MNESQNDGLLDELAPLFARYSEYLRDSYKHERTITGYLRDLQVVFRAVNLELGVKSMKELTCSHMEAALGCRTITMVDGRDRGAYSMNRIVSALRSFLGWAEKEGLCQSGMKDKIRPVNMSDQKVAVVSKERIDKLVEMLRFASASDKMALRDYTMLLLVLRAGMRVRQVAWMRVSEVNIEDSTIGIRCMFTGRLEHRKVRRSTMEIIERYMATLKPGTECLFSSPTKKRLSERQIIERFKEWGNRAGVGHITPALLRKTYGARVYVRTKDPLRVARALGVRDIRSVEQFTQFADMTPEEMGLD